MHPHLTSSHYGAEVAAGVFLVLLAGLAIDHALERRRRHRKDPHNPNPPA